MADTRVGDCQQNILNVPEEICEQIFKTHVLNYSDLKSISETCKYFCHVCSSNELWKKKLQQRYPDLYDQYERGVRKSWRHVFKQRFQYGRQISRMVSGLSAVFYQHQEMSKEGFSAFIVLMEEHDDAGTYIVDELMSTVHKGKGHDKLTDKYYAEKVLRHLHQIYLMGKWREYLLVPETEQNLETGAVLIAQWCQPTTCVTQNTVSDQLDDIAAMVITEVGQRSADHPLCAMQQYSQVLEQDLWSPQQGRVVLEALNHVLFEKLGFHGNEDNYYDPHNSYLNKVLEVRKGIPITLSVVYSGVARRLGVVCQPVNFPSHFLLRWRQRPVAPVPQQFLFIDVFRGGKFYQQDECCQAIGIPSSMGQQDNYNSIPTKKVLERMSRNLVRIGRHQSQLGDGLLCLRNALDLFLIIHPGDLEMRLLQIRINLHLNINLLEVIDDLQRVADLDPNRMGLVALLQQEAERLIKDNHDNGNVKVKVKEKRRKDNPGVKFSVGLIMKHKRYDYKCVIFGWDETCQASEEWIIQMGVDNLPKKHTQPFYNVLVDDGSNRYAAQENMLYTSCTTEITHPEVGRYFQTFRGTHYVANAEKGAEYPDDHNVTQALLQRYHQEQRSAEEEM